MKKLLFSMIEMITVVVVVLILITLTLPSIKGLQKKARTIACGQQLKELGSLIATYALDNDGRLPYSRNRPSFSAGSYSYKDKRAGKLYGSWAGHLIPYLEKNVPTWSRGQFYHDGAKKGGGNSIVFTLDIDGITKPTAANTNENHLNWKLLNNMFYEGGYASLKNFICPEAATTFTAREIPNERYIPRISGIIPPGSGTGLYGLPSSYLGNGDLFGSRGYQSMRLEDTNKTNFLLLEGCDQFTFELSGMCTRDYKHVFEQTTPYGGSVNNIVAGFGPTKDSPTTPVRNMAFSFMHDNTEEVWFSSRSGGMGINNVSRYNKVFYPNAIASTGLTYTYNIGILGSNQYPGDKWENYELPFTKNKFKIFRYYSEERKANYMYGDMNILIADLSVRKAHIGWVFENARSLGEKAN